MQPDQEQRWEQPDQTASGETPQPQDGDPSVMSWQASEYVQHDKDGMWFAVLGFVAVALLGLDYVLIRSWTFALLIVVMAVGVGVMARRAPRILSYSLSSASLQIDDKHINLRDFRAFGVLQEESMYSIRLIPKKRFMPAVNVFFPPEYGEKIVDAVGLTLPLEHIEHDFVDNLAQKIRF